MPMTTPIILYHLVYGGATLKSFKLSNKWIYALERDNEAHIGFVAEGAMRSMVSDGCVMNDRFNMDDDSIIYRVTLRGIELAPKIRPPSFPVLARGDVRKALPDA